MPLTHITAAAAAACLSANPPLPDTHASIRFHCRLLGIAETRDYFRG